MGHMNIRPISVIVCTHNRADLLPGVLNQLRAQDYHAEAFEIVVVDNCSSDRTPEVVERFVAEPGVPVRYIAESRPGITFARNRGAEVSRYPYVAFLDDDCSVEPDWLSQLVSGFDLDDNVAAVGGRVVLDWDQQEEPAWLGPELEPWLAAYSHSGTQPKLLEWKVRIIECNMALKREAWKAAGGFLGMEQFGSKHLAASEVLYLLKQIERQRGKVAYIPGAIAHHHIGQRSRQWMLRRAYWQGVSDGILDYLIKRRSWQSTISRIILDAAAMICFFSLSGISYIKADQAKYMFHLMRAVRRFSLVLSEMRLVGDWARVRSWASAHHTAK
jgi:glycosyltransferase involved in cell wall biosynthesis